MEKGKKILLEAQLQEVKFKIDLLDYDYGYFKKFEKSLKQIRKYFKDNEINFDRGFGYSISSTKTNSFRDGESKQRFNIMARLKLDEFDSKVKEADKSIKSVKDEISNIFNINGLEVFDVKYRENKPEELVITIKI